MNFNFAPGGRKRLCWGVLLLLAVSCGDGARTTAYVDDGEACITSTEQGGAVVQVTFRTCLSSSCDTLQEANCTLDVSDDTLRISSQGVVESKGDICTLDCQTAAAVCEIAAIEPGEYTVIHGDQQKTVSFPNLGGVLIGEPWPAGVECGSE